MVPDETEDEEQAEDGKEHIVHEQLLEVDTNEEPSKDFDLYVFEFRVVAITPVPHTFLEICHKFCLFALVVLDILVALRTVSDWTGMAPNCAHELHFWASSSDFVAKENSPEFAPHSRISNRICQLLLNLRLSHAVNLRRIIKETEGRIH